MMACATVWVAGNDSLPENDCLVCGWRASSHHQISTWISVWQRSWCLLVNVHMQVVRKGPQVHGKVTSGLSEPLTCRLHGENVNSLTSWHVGGGVCENRGGCTKTLLAIAVVMSRRPQLSVFYGLNKVTFKVITEFRGSAAPLCSELLLRCVCLHAALLHVRSSDVERDSDVKLVRHRFTWRHTHTHTRY